MAGTSHIEWTDATWNPVTGCTKVSPGCKNCYAARMSKRLQAMQQPNYRNGFSLTLQPHMLDAPLQWKQPKRIFVNSMSDLFHPSVPSEYILEVFAVMQKAHWHEYQILTKRSKRLRDMDSSLNWLPNIWMGVSVESEEYRFRVEDLRQTKSFTKFLSIEPLLGPIRQLNLRGIDWVIVGGESGPGARKMSREWVRQIRDQCLEESVPFFFKQWGGVFKRKTGRVLDGRTWNQMPHPLL